MKRTFKIFTEGGGTKGLGHISRCSSIYDELVQKGLTGKMYIYSSDADLNVFNGRDIEFIDWYNHETLEMIITANDYVVVDSYHAPQQTYDLIASKAYKALFFDDFNRLKYPKVLVVNPMMTTNEISNQDELKYLMGSEYIVLRKAFQNVYKTTINKAIKNVFITLGSIDNHEIVRDIIDYLKSISPKLHVTALTSSCTFLHKELNYKKFECFASLSETEMRNTIMESDFVISAAGQTVFELITTNTPFITLQTAANQHKNTEYLKSIKSDLSILRTLDGYSKNDVEQWILKMFEDEYRNDCFKKFNEFNYSNGAKNIIHNFLSKEIEGKL